MCFVTAPSAGQNGGGAVRVGSIMRTLLLALVMTLAACGASSYSAADPDPDPVAVDAAAVSPDPAPTPAPQGPAATTAVRASSYDQYCTRDEECVAVFQGNACQPCRCATAAIRRDALPVYRAELGAFWSCHEPEACAADCTAVIGDPAVCRAGTCVLPEPL
jgi:hypothetical protein